MCVPCLCMRGIITAGRHTSARSSLDCEQNNISLLLFVFITLESRVAGKTWQQWRQHRLHYSNPKSHRKLPPPRAKFKTGFAAAATTSPVWRHPSHPASKIQPVPGMQLSSGISKQIGSALPAAVERKKERDRAGLRVFAL